jgi:hypothetical protein
LRATGPKRRLVKSWRQVPKATERTPLLAAPGPPFVECERKISKYLVGLEAGIPGDVVASRIASAQRERATAQAVPAPAPPAPEPLALEEVVETLKALRDLPELLDTVD